MAVAHKVFLWLQNKISATLFQENINQSWKRRFILSRRNMRKDLLEIQLDVVANFFL